MLLRSTDSGAPTLTGETGALYNVFKWALPQLGWTIEFDNNSDVIVFRNSTVSGTGDYLRLDDNPANHNATDAKSAAVSSFSTMSDINTGTVQVGGASTFLFKSHLTDSTARQWAISGDATYFWYFAPSSDSTGYIEFYIGDIQSNKVSDPGRFLTQGHTITSPSSSSNICPYLIYGDAVSGFSQLRSTSDGAIAPITIQYQRFFNVDSVAGNTGRPGAAGTYPDPVSGGIAVQDVLVFDNGTRFRGRLKGAMIPGNNVVGQFADFHLIAGQATPRGPKDCYVLNRRSRPSSLEGVILIDSDHGDTW